MTDYTAADMLAQLVAGVQVVLPWLGVAVAAAVGLFAFYFGIRMGLRFLRDLVDYRRGEGIYSPHYSDVHDGDSDWGYSTLADGPDGLSDFRSPDGWEAADARVWGMYYDYDVSQGGSGTAYADARLARDRAGRG